MAKKYEPEVKAIIVSEINRQLAVEVGVEDINLSLLQRFPYASLRFSHVVVPQVIDGKPAADTLIYIRDLYLQIGLLDFLRQEYRVTEAAVNGGFFDMAIYANGSDNYHFWKTDSIATSTSFSIQNVAMQGFAYRLDQAGKTKLDLWLDGANISGDFQSEKFDVALEVDALLRSLKSGKDEWYSNLPLKGDLNINVDLVNNRYRFAGEELDLAGQDYNISGSYFDQDSKSDLELAIATRKASLDRVLKLIPANARGAFQQYELSGKTNLEVKLKSNADFSLDAQFDGLTGVIKHVEGLGRCQINRGNLKLELRNDAASLFIEDIEAQIGAGRFTAWGSAINLAAPTVDLELRGLLELAELQKLFNLTGFAQLDGSIAFDGRLKGKFPKNAADQQLETLKRVNFIGRLDLKDCLFQLANQNQVFDRLNGAIQIKDNSILVEEATGRVNENPFELRGSIENALPYLYSPDQSIFIKALCKADLLDFNRILSGGSNSSSENYTIELPKRLSFEIQFRAERLIFRRFEAKAISGTAHYGNQLLTVNPFQFETASGQIGSHLSLRTKAGEAVELSIEARVRNIDLSKLLYEFEDFGQESVRSKNVAGRANIDLTFSAEYSKNLDINAKTIRAESALEVMNGKLIEVPSLVAIAPYLRKNALWRSLIKMDSFEKKLASIDFDTLRNQISIANEVIVIPKMQINSSALNLGLSGKHYFDDRIDYAFSFRISELLQTGKKPDSEFGDVQDDGTGLKLFLRMNGTTANPEFAIDQQGARDKRKAQFEAEKGTFKEVLNKEFGLFGKDTTRVVLPEKQQKKPTFEVEWDAQKTKADSLRDVEEKAKPKKSPLIKEKSKEELIGDDDL